MKVITFATILLASATAFSPVVTTSPRSTTTALSAESKNDNHQWKPAVAALLLGLTLASPMALADAASLDFSLPKYDTKMGGFGDGTEARLEARRELTDPGSGEKDKELAAMRKAEDARKERMKKEKEVKKERENEDKRRAMERKERDAERLKNIWG
jgi:hypothetical protein